MFLIKEDKFSAKLESTDLQMRTLLQGVSLYLIEKCVRAEINLCVKNRAKYKWGAFCTRVKNKLGGTFIGYESLVSIFKVLWVTYIHTYVHTYIHTFVHTYIHVYAYMRACAHRHIFVYICILTYAHTYIHACICVHAPMVYIYIYTRGI